MVDIISEHAFFKDLSAENQALVAACGKNAAFKEGTVLANPGDMADTFYLIREGKVNLYIDLSPGQSFIFQTLGKDDILGISWLIPPYRWTVTARVVTPVHAFAFDGACLRKKCEEDPILGFKIMKHLVQVLVNREEATRLHLLDVYGKK